MADYGADDAAYFDALRSRKWNVQNEYGLGMAQNLQQRLAATRQLGQDQTNQKWQFAQMREGLPGGYAGRGLLNSGIYQRGLSDYGIQRDNATATLLGGYQDRAAALDANQAGLEQTRRNGLDDLASSDAARRAAIAARLRSAAIS